MRSFPLSSFCEVLRGVDVEQFARRETHATRASRADELVQGKPASLDLPFNERQESNGHDDGEAGLAPGDGKHCALPVEYRKAATQGSGRNKWHVAGKEEDRESVGGLQGGVNAAERSTTPHQVLSQDANRQSECGGISAHATQERPVAKTESRFGTSHPGTQAAREDADFDGRRHFVQCKSPGQKDDDFCRLNRLNELNQLMVGVYHH